MIKIKKTNSNFEREPLLSAFGFKGGYLTELWQNIAFTESENGHRGLGLATQSVLWSDGNVFSSNTEYDGNSMMHQIMAYALQKTEEIPFETPFDLLDHLLPDAYKYGKSITGNNDLRLTFVLNALVAVDNAAWQIYCAENCINNFDGMLPEDIRPALSKRHSALACVPLMTYGVPLDDIIAAVDAGFFFLKIKIGSDPDGDGDHEKMLEWDKNRLSAIHSAVKDRRTPYTEDGRIRYYLDANGRYDCKERLMRLLDHAEGIGALEQIAILEEPFPEEFRFDVRDIPARLAADESAHSDKDTLERIEMGYTAIALKPIAKTMSMSLKIAKLAYAKDVPCFCADLTVNPILVDWNKNVAAGLAALPGMKIGVIETNGHQNYRNWEVMKSYHPDYGVSWMQADDGIFHLDDDFYTSSGGILDMSEHYLNMVL